MRGSQKQIKSQCNIVHAATEICGSGCFQQMDSYHNDPTANSAGEIESLLALNLPDLVAERPDFLRRLLTSIGLGAPETKPKVTCEGFLSWADEDYLGEWFRTT